MESARISSMMLDHPMVKAGVAPLPSPTFPKSISGSRKGLSSLSIPFFYQNRRSKRERLLLKRNPIAEEKAAVSIDGDLN
jgi:hypothetical protein